MLITGDFIMFYCTECTDDVNMLLQTFDFFEISQRHLSTVADIAKFLSGHRRAPRPR